MSWQSSIESVERDRDEPESNFIMPTDYSFEGAMRVKKEREKYNVENHLGVHCKTFYNAE